MNKISITMALCLLGVAGVYWLAQAGPLDPPGEPGPTGCSLEQIYQKLYDCRKEGLPYSVPKTGQTGCWDALGDPITDCVDTGQDGEYQAGVSVDPRFSDNGDGTVKDWLTGLVWLKNAGCKYTDWITAMQFANSLADGSCGLTDGSVPGDWGLPNIRQLQSLIDYGQAEPALPPDHPFVSVERSHRGPDHYPWYWSSTTNSENEDYAWVVEPHSGSERENAPKSGGSSAANSVWPVRGQFGVGQP